MAAILSSIPGAVILVEDGLQIVANIIAAIQAARKSGSATIPADVLAADVKSRDDALAQLDKDLAAGS